MKPVKNKRLIRLLAGLLAAVLLFVCAGCGSTAATALSFGDVKINANVFSYWMSKYKAMYLYSMFGTTTDNVQYWTYEMAQGTGVTVGDYFGSMAVSNIGSNAVMLKLFADYGLSLSPEEQNSIDNAITSMISKSGSKSALNSALSPFGVNADILKQIYVMEAKINAVKNYLYGENGTEAATADELNKYFNENYYRCKHILIRTDVKYERGADGLPIVDQETQTYKTLPLTADEIEEQRALAKDLELRVASGEDYDALVIQYSEDTGMQRYDDGYYVTSATTFLPAEIISEVMKMKVGEVKTVNTSFGISIVKRYDLIDGAYNTDPYKSEQIGDLASIVNTVKLQELISSYANLIEFNDTVIKDYPIAYCTPNFYY